MFFNDTAQENKCNPRSSGFPILVESLIPRDGSTSFADAGGRQSVQVSCAFVVVVRFFCLCGTREAEARRTNSIDAKVCRRCHHSQEMKRFNQSHCCFQERRGRGGRGALDSIHSRPTRPPGRRIYDGFGFLTLSGGRPVLHVQALLCPALPALPALHLFKDHDEKKEKGKKTRLWLHYIVL